MTDMTDNEKRVLREWAEENKLRDEETHLAARYILANVDAPAPTLAEELRSWAEDASYDEDRDNLLHAASRAKQMEHDSAEARAEVERVTAQNTWPKHTPSGHTYDAPTTYKKLLQQCANAAQAASEGWDDAECPPEPTWEMVGLATAEVDRLTAQRDEKEVLDAIEAHYDNYAVQKGAESTAETTDPADVKPGEAWIVECRGEKRAAVKDRDDNNEPWNTFNADGWYLSEDNEDVTLVSRLVPAPRVITDHDGLDRAKRLTVIHDGVGVVCERAALGDGWFTTGTGVDQTPYIQFPATVIWEPGA